MIRIYLPSSLASSKLQTSLDFVIAANPDDHHGGKGPTFTLRRMPKVDVTPSMPYVLMDATAADHLITMRRELLLKDKPEFPERLSAAPAASSDHLQVPRKSPRAADLTPESVWVMEFASDSGESAVMDDVDMDRIAEIRSEHDLPLFDDEPAVDRSFALDLENEPKPFSAPSPDPAPAVGIEPSPAADAADALVVNPVPLEEGPDVDAALSEAVPMEAPVLDAIVPEPVPVESPVLDAAPVVLETPSDVQAVPAGDDRAAEAVVEAVAQQDDVEPTTAAVEDALPHVEAVHEPADVNEAAVPELDACVAEDRRDTVEPQLSAAVDDEPAVEEIATVEEIAVADPAAILPVETAPAAAVVETEREIAAETTMTAPAVPELVVIADAPAEPKSAATTAPAPLSSDVHPSSSDDAETAPSLAVFADDNDDAHSTSVVPLFTPSDLLLDDASTRSMAGSFIPHHARSIISDRVEPATSPEPPVHDGDEDSAESASQFQTIQDLIARLDAVDVSTPVLGAGLVVEATTTTTAAAEMSEDAPVPVPEQEEEAATKDVAKPESTTASENPFLIATKLFDAMETHLVNLSLPDVHITAPLDDAVATPAEDAPVAAVRTATPVLSVTALAGEDAESGEDEGMLSSAVDMEGFPKVPTLKSASSMLMDVPHYTLSTDDSEGDESHKDEDEMSSHEEEEESESEPEQQQREVVDMTLTVVSPKLASPKLASPKPAAASPRFSTPALSTAALSATVLSVPVLSVPASPAVAQAAPSPVTPSPAVAHAEPSPVLTIPRLSVPNSPAVAQALPSPVVTEPLPSPTIPAPPALVAQPALAPSPIASTATPADASIDPPSRKPVPELHYESFPPAVADLAPIAPAMAPAASGPLPAIREDQDDSNPTANTHTNGNDEGDEDEDDGEIEFSADSAYDTPSLGTTPSSSAFDPAMTPRKNKKDKKLLPRLRHSLQVTLRRASHSEPSTPTTVGRRDSAPTGPLVMDLVPAAPAKKRSLLRKMLDKFASSGSDDERDPRAAKQPKSKLFRKEKKDLGKRRGDVDEQPQQAASSSAAAAAEGGKKSKRFSVFKK
ncbi:hypothetical protein GGF31_004224 [Allomyces arbusculus]|nr:hypothetical protein GGF31_004224 [Allomyces arbusculus]